MNGLASGSRRRAGCAWMLSLVLCIGAAKPVPVSGQDSGWIRITTPHFDLLTSAGEFDGRGLIQRFEMARSFFLTDARAAAMPADPVRIVAFHSDAQFDKIRVTPTADAFYTGGSNGDYIAMKDASYEYRSTAIHEYMHLLLRLSGMHAPLWWQEGQAEFFSTLKPAYDGVVVGAASEMRLNSLKGRPLIDLASFFAADMDSPLYRDPKQVNIYYAQCWLLAHMLFFSETYLTHMAEFTRQLESGKLPEEVFRGAFGKTLTEVQSDLDAYRRQRTLRSKVVRVEIDTAVETPVIAPASEIEVQVAIANIALGAGKADLARQLLDALAPAHPDSWEIEESLGYVYWYIGDRAQSRLHFGSAVAKGLPRAKTIMDYVGLLGETGVSNATLIPLVEKALRFQPSYPLANLNLASMLVSEGEYDRALTRLDKSNPLPFADRFQALCLRAYAHLGLNQFDQADQAAREARTLALTEGELKETDLLFRSIANRRLASARVSLRQLLSIDPPGNLSLIMVPTPSLAVPEVPKAPSPKLRQFDGRLRRIDCLEAGLHFVVDSGGKEVSFRVADPAAISVKGKRGNKVTFYCGLQPGMPVVVTYLPEPNAKSGTAGQMTVIEFI
jgi:Flp pilus assembly protein TadD